MNSMDKTREFLKSVGLPGGDAYDLPTSEKRFKGGVIKSSSGNKMNEIGPHRCWAEKIVMRAKAYGVIEDESKYTDLFN